jgi:hypothetical protein
LEQHHHKAVDVEERQKTRYDILFLNDKLFFFLLKWVKSTVTGAYQAKMWRSDLAQIRYNVVMGQLDPFRESGGAARVR